MIDAYASDIDFANVMSALAIGKTQDPYMLKDGFLLYELRLCVTQALRKKVMNESHAPPYAKASWYSSYNKCNRNLLLLAINEKRHTCLCFTMLDMPKNKVEVNTHVYLNHCQYQMHPGRVYPWILSLDYQNLFMVIRVYGQ